MMSANRSEALGIFAYLLPGEVPVGFVGRVVETEDGSRRQLVVANTNVEHIKGDGERGRLERVVLVPVPGI